MAKILQKSKSWVAKWSSSQEFYDKPRSGRPVIEKAKYKRGNCTRKISKQLKNKGLPGSAATVWRYMSRKGWKPLRRKKLPLLSNNQRKARLVLARKYRKFTADEWENFLFSDECPKYLFHLPNPKNDIVWGSQDGLGWHDRLRPYFPTFHSESTSCNGRVLCHKNPWERSEASFQPKIYNRRACKTKTFHEQ